MEETLQGSHGLESNETAKENQAKIESSPNEVNVSDLIATLKNVKTEEQELLSKRKELQTTQNDLTNQVKTEIDAKKTVISGLKSEIAFLQNKCNELERALGIPVFE